MKFINSLSIRDRFNIYSDTDFADILHNEKVIPDDLHKAAREACYCVHNVYAKGLSYRPFLEVEFKEYIEDVFGWLHEVITAVSEKDSGIAAAIDELARDIYDSIIPLF